MREWPDLSVLELLVRVEEQGSVGAAARAMSMAQPNASRALSTLEARLGLSLIKRTTRGSHLTHEGAKVAEWARATLASAHHLLDGVATLKKQDTTRLSVGASLTIAEYLIPRWLGQFRQEHPNIELSVSLHNSERIYQGVQQGEFDLGFVESPEKKTGLKEALVGHDRMTLVVDPDHPWAQQDRPITLEDVAATPLVVREKGSGTRVTLDTFLAPYDPVAPAVELTSNSAVRISVQAGVGPAVLSQLVVESALKEDELVAIPVTGMTLLRSFRVVWNGPNRLIGPRADMVTIATEDMKNTLPVLTPRMRLYP